MAKTPSPWKNPKSWDKPKIGGHILPGVVRLQEVGISLRVQPQKASGSDGGGTTLRGLEIPDFTFICTLNNDEDHDAWDALVPLLLPRKDATTRGVFSVYHPSLARYLITSCIVKHAGEVPPIAGGPLIGKIECLAVSPKKAAPASKPKPKAATTAPAVALPNGTRQAKDIRDYVKRPSSDPKVQGDW